jgi:hypothetical protein
MFAALREDEPHLPPNHLVHVAYADLVADPVGQLRRAFDALGFEWRPAAESALRAHAARVASVQARREPLLDVAARRDVRRHWAWVFDRWGYES